MSELFMRLRHYTFILSILAFGGVVSGCASHEPGSPAAVAQEAKVVQKAKIEATEETVDELPDWFLNMPTAEHSVFARGTATSPDLQLAMDKAVLFAKRTLADRINGQISSKIKSFIAEIGQAEDTEVITEIEQVTTNLIANVTVVGYSQKEAKVIPQGTQYRAYVLLQYPVGKANRMLVDQVKKNRVLEARLRASKAFKELEEDVKRARSTN